MGSSFTKEKDVVIFRNALDTSQEDFDNIGLKTFNKCYPKEDERNVMLEKFNEKKVEVRVNVDVDVEAEVYVEVEVRVKVKV